MKIITVPYPFVMHEVSLQEGEIYSWTPGVRFESDGFDGFNSFADGMGSMILETVAEFKPEKYPTRIFFIRTWVDPDGKEFGKRRLRITTKAAFERLKRGYRHEFEMEEKNHE